MGKPRTGRFSHVVFRIGHDCPVSLLSREFPKLDFFTWSVHKQEIAYAPCGAELKPKLAEAVSTHCRGALFLEDTEGLAWSFPASLPKSRSISWQLEQRQALWLQPLRCREGWEYFDVIALDLDEFRSLVDRLHKRFPLEVVRRAPLSPADLATSFFVPLSPAVRNLTPKQLEALRAAHANRYYEQPRGATTRDVAKRLGVSRSAFEERLRNAENAVLSGVVSALSGLIPAERTTRRK